VAPLARVEVELEEPRLRFSGSGYHDTNFGDEPLEAAFESWNWSRAELPDGAAILYDVERLAGDPLRLGRLFCRDGRVEPLEAPAPCPLPSGTWGEPRATRTDAGGRAQVVKTLETSPFYARSLLRTELGGASALSMHEALSLTRFTRGWVQFLLPFRMRSRRRWPW
jgi:carotenoid 1,2-hydratase